MKNKKYIGYISLIVLLGLLLSENSILSSSRWQMFKEWSGGKTEGLKQWASENKGKAAAAMAGVLAALGISGYYGYKKYYAAPKEVAKLTQEYNQKQEENVKEIEKIQQKDDKFINELINDLEKGDITVQEPTFQEQQVVQVPIAELKVEEILEMEEPDISISRINFQGPKAKFLDLNTLKNLSENERAIGLENGDYIESAKKSHYYYNFTFTTKANVDNIINNDYKVNASTIILLSKDMKTFLFDSKRNVRNTAQKLAETELKKNIYSEEKQAYSAVFILMDYENADTTKKSLDLIKNLFFSEPNNANYKNTKLTLMIAGKGHSTENLKDILTQVGSISTSKQTQNAQFVLEKLHTVYLSANCLNGFIGTSAKAKEKGAYIKSFFAKTTTSRLDQFFTNLDHPISFYNWYVYDNYVGFLPVKFFESYIRERYNKNAFFSNVCLKSVVVDNEIWSIKPPLKEYSERTLVDLFFGRIRSLLMNAEFFEQNQDYCFIEEKNKDGETQRVYFIDDIFLPRGAQFTFHNQLAKRKKLEEDASIQDRFVDQTNQATYDILHDETYYNKSETNKDGQRKITMFEMVPGSGVSRYIANSLKYMIPSAKKSNDIKEIIDSYAKKGIEKVKEQINK